MAIDPGGAPDHEKPDPTLQRQIGLRIPEHVRLCHSPDGAAVLDILHGQMFRLNFVGSRILELIEQNSAEPEIAEQLAHEFGIDRAFVEADVHEFLKALGKHNLLASRAS